MKFFDTHSHQGYDLAGQYLTQLIVETLPRLPSHQSHLNFPNTRFLYAAGLHPWKVTEFNNFDSLPEILGNPNISAVGEIGLDFYADYLPFKQIQLLLFEQQLSLALELELPVSIHCRAAFPDLHALLTRYPVRGCIHGFMGSVEQALQFIKLGLKIGINGVVCRANARKYHRLATEISLSSLVLESDFPYVTDRQNKPVLVDKVALSVATLREMPLDELVETTYDTASTIFKGAK